MHKIRVLMCPSKSDKHLSKSVNHFSVLMCPPLGMCARFAHGFYVHKSRAPFEGVQTRE